MDVAERRLWPPWLTDADGDGEPWSELEDRFALEAVDGLRLEEAHRASVDAQRLAGLAVDVRCQER